MRHIYADFVGNVATPARYLGGEYQSAVKDPGEVDARVVLAFPDLYDIGMSHLGTKILYSLLNKNPRIWAERAFTPWTDMEAELRARDLPLVSLESQTPLSEFDVIGMSLQYELTFTNVLTMLELGGVALRAADRDDGAPLVIGGGPVATHPEPMAPFFDAFFIGEAEQELPQLVLDAAALRREGRSRLDVLAELGARYPLYVPALYETHIDDDTGMVVVGAPLDPRLPARVRRGVVDNIDDFPFPSDTPVPYAEAVFDRAAVEIARGCTEGCRFCQAGMIYRPVRERSPQSIIDSLVDGVNKAGYDETSLTCLSTADYSSVAPLVSAVMKELRPRKVSLSVASLRAYGLNEGILDEMASMRITGLTFAPEAGSQRMRDVVNKNVTEAHVLESTERVFGRGWHRLKLYFMIGLPTEKPEDVRGIVETGQRMLAIGRQKMGRKAEITVSVSSHVPKPHTPFQWCAQDSIAEIADKQSLLRRTVTERQLRLKYHDRGISFVEGVMARGDRRVGEAIELAWRKGARFDGWDELFDVDRWGSAFDECGLDTATYLATRPVTARLPWDHIDVGLEDGFLLREYRKALKSRLSPPCGKVVGDLVHHTNVAEATADKRKLVCYDCGVACDLVDMRGERLTYLRQLGAEQPVPKREAPVRVASSPTGDRRKRKPRPAFPDVPSTRYRVRYTKLGRAAFLGHLDTMRALARLFRRADIRVAYSRGFHPKPIMHFSPALSLGIASFGELLDLQLEGNPDPAELLARMREVSPEGTEFTGVWRAPEGKRKLSKVIRAYDLLIQPAADGMTWDERRMLRISESFLAKESTPVVRKEKTIDVRAFVGDVAVLDAAASEPLCAALGWPVAQALLRATVDVTPDGSAKPVEVARALGVAGTEQAGAPPVHLARLGFRGESGDAAAELASLGTALSGPAEVQLAH